MHQRLALFSLALVFASCSPRPGASANVPKPAPSPASTPTAPPAASAKPVVPLDWKILEAPLLIDHVQLTSRDQFVRAGEAYFSPDGEWIIFQAVKAPEPGQEPAPFYAMFVAKLEKDATGRVVGIAAATRVSPPDSANTCGWFHPTDPTRVLFGSTSIRPSDEQKSGFQVGTRRYVWMFPQEMDIVEWGAFAASGDGKDARRVGTNRAMPRPEPVFSRPNYDAECSYSSDGRFILYAHIEDAPATPDAHAESKTPPKPDANIYIYDTKTKLHHAIVTAPGYDGGPFFSPDNKSICYRSDREGTDLLQLFVGDLKFEKDEAGDSIPVGIEREYQLTKNEHVNWCPFWHPSGKYLVYGSSEVGHTNYEVFAVEVDREQLSRLASGVKPGATIDASAVRHARVTQASGADVLPAFSADGRYMMWTAQRGPQAPGESRATSQLWVARVVGDPFAAPTR